MRTGPAADRTRSYCKGTGKNQLNRRSPKLERQVLICFLCSERDHRF